MSFQIPGARLIEEILAGMPTNSQQAIQLREFAVQMEMFKKENEALKTEVDPKCQGPVETGQSWPLPSGHPISINSHFIFKKLPAIR